MSAIINASIDLAKIDESKVFTKNGKRYVSLSISINDTVNQYGQNVGISISQKQEEKGQPKTYVGNGKVVWTDGNALQVAPKTEQPKPENSSPANPNDDDLPF